ncbi:unannotated protein [freshwater metagenome]|uniref:Unannotated protein n=1 Tax=freshwater metagenome TaxID=449393 RepID=A0A6J7A7Z3_9ZZZZ
MSSTHSNPTSTTTRAAQLRPDHAKNASPDSAASAANHTVGTG